MKQRGVVSLLLLSARKTGGDDGAVTRYMMPPDSFATKDEVLIGMSAGARQHGESLFKRMNNR